MARLSEQVIIQAVQLRDCTHKPPHPRHQPKRSRRRPQ
jgi:hypothetical protein